MTNSNGKIPFRRFERVDLFRCAQLAVDAWPIIHVLVPPKDVVKLMKAYVQMNRLGSTWLEVAISNNKIIGFLFARLNKDYKTIDRISRLLPSLYILLKIIIGKYGRLAEPFIFLKHLIATEEKVQEHTPQIDGELTLFVVDSEFRGMGIGTSLLNRFLIKAKQVNAKLIAVYTDPLSIWQFYEKFGFIRQGEFLDDLNTYMKKVDIKGFIYTLNL